MRFSFCNRVGREVWLLLIAIISFLFTALLILPMLGGIALVTGIGNDGELFFLTLLFILVVALTIRTIILRRARKSGRKVALALLHYWLVLLGFSLAVNLIFNLAESINLSAAKRELRAAGIPLTVKEIIPPPVPAEKNAAPTFQKAFVLVEELKKKHEQEWESLLWIYYPHRFGAKTSSKSANTFKVPKGLRGPSEEVIQAKDITTAQAAKLVLDNPDFQNLYKLIDQAVSFPSCRFDINYKEGPSLLLPHLAPLRGFARLNSARTYLLAGNSRYSEALESARAGLRIGDCLKNEPLFISQSLRKAVDSIGMTAFNDLLNRVPGICSAKDYQILIQELDKKNINAELKTGIKNDIFLDGYSLFNCILQGRLPPIMCFACGAGTELDRIKWLRYTSWITNPFSKHDFAFYLRTMNRVVAEIDKPYYQTKDFYSHLEKELTTSKAMHHPLSTIIIAPNFGGYNNRQYLTGGSEIPIRNAMHLSNFDGFKIDLALRMYKMKTGRYPDKLSALVPDILLVLPLDQFTGKDFIYHKKGTGVIVYGVGPNLVDDNGKKDPETKPPSDDIAWEVK